MHFSAQIKTKPSKDAFEKAIRLDQGDPLPRLGLGLARIREGDLAEGREEIEIAASLDPNNALIRSYLGKGFYEEKREALASRQFAMAKELDPSDPTPYFYDAILKQSTNRPVEALHDMQEAISLNNNRAVYRSRLLLDSDLAARSASLARIYSDLGFQQLALVEGWKSVNTDPANFSAHRFLADSYLALPRHEIARVSEVLQSQLLQPITINPVPPLLAESNLQGLTAVGASQASFNEYNPLFNRNRFALQASGIAGERDTWGDEVLQSGVWGRFSYSLGQVHYETDGFRENNDLKKNIYDIFAQMSLSYATSIQGEFRASDVKKGDLTQNFFGDLLDQRQKENDKTVRFGFHHGFSPGSDLVGSLMYVHGEPELDQPGFQIETDQDSYSAEFQHLLRSERFNLISGAGHFYIDKKNVASDPLFSSAPRINHTNLYLYSQIHYPRNVTFTLGGSADFLQGGLKDRNQFNPKFGITWTPFPSTTVRGALFRVVNRTLITNQTIEPTQVAGFNQFFLDGDAATSWRYGAAVDQKLFRNLYGGLEYSRRNLDIVYIDDSSRANEADWQERLGRAYLYWTPTSYTGFSAEYHYEWFDREKKFVAGINHLRTHRVPLGISVYHPFGFSALLQATYIDQSGLFQPLGTSLRGADQAWIIDGLIRYRLPNRLGLISLGVSNLFNKHFDYQETDPLGSFMQPKRFIYGKFTLSF